jgi:hypothetical protein
MQTGLQAHMRKGCTQHAFGSSRQPCPQCCCLTEAAAAAADSPRNDVVAFHGQLSDYLIKVAPGWIRFAVAGPGQSFNAYNEATVYTTPEHLLPLVRCVLLASDA